MPAPADEACDVVAGGERGAQRLERRVGVRGDIAVRVGEGRPSGGRCWYPAARGLGSMPGQWRARRACCRSCPGGTRPRDGVTVHRASGLYAHVTWHTYRRMRTIRKYDVAAIVEAVLYDLVLCATRQVRVLAARERGAEGRAATAMVAWVLHQLAVPRPCARDEVLHRTAGSASPEIGTGLTRVG